MSLYKLEKYWRVPPTQSFISTLHKIIIKKLPVNIFNTRIIYFWVVNINSTRLNLEQCLLANVRRSMNDFMMIKCRHTVRVDVHK